VDIFFPNLKRHPRFAEAKAQAVVLSPGDTLVLPGGWWRYAVALEPSVTLHHPFWNLENRKHLIDELREAFSDSSMPPELRERAENNFTQINEHIMDDDESDEEDAADGYGRDARGHAPVGHSVQHSAAVSTGQQHGQPGVMSSAKAALPIEALELPQLEVLPLNHTHSMRFRAMTLDAKTQQAYLRDKKHVNRAQKYQCLVCAVNHDFRLSKFAASAEHQHM